ncbi:MAG: DUF5518 domain-containing protein [Haloarculaceae archaeon]
MESETYVDPRSPWLNALVGAAVTVVLSFTGFSPLVGGAVAGYLQDEGQRGGLRVGALAGVLALVPLFVLFALFVGWTSLLMVGTGAPRGMVGVPLVLSVVGLFVSGFVVGLSAVGGLLGGALAERARDSDN